MYCGLEQELERVSVFTLLAYFSFIDPRLYIPARVTFPLK